MLAAVILNADVKYIFPVTLSDIEPPISSGRSKWSKKRFEVLSCTRIEEKKL